jgi:hypothetical protein
MDNIVASLVVEQEAIVVTLDEGLPSGDFLQVPVNQVLIPSHPSITTP